MTPEQAAALDQARALARHGVPLFVARPDPTARLGFALPSRWEAAEADPATVDLWQPGWALCAVTGVALDLVDVDPRSGGEAGDWLPFPYAVADTPSGGRHYWVAPLGIESLDGKSYRGVDVKSGAADGRGRGFGFIAPTERASKVDGVVRGYRWADVRLDLLGTAPDYSGAPLRARIAEVRMANRSTADAPRVVPRSVAAREYAAAYAALVADVRTWARDGWGGEAHAGLLRHSTHLARLAPFQAIDAYVAAFREAGAEPDEDDLAKMEQALAKSVPDVVVEDAELDPQRRFFDGGTFEGEDGGGGTPLVPEPSPARARRGGFVFYTEHELSDIPAPETLVDGLLWQDSVARLFGPSSVGKTFVALDLAAHVARGEAWQGREVKQGPVLYVAAEGAPSIGPRLAAWRSFVPPGQTARRGDTGVLCWPEPVQIEGPSWAEFVAACAAIEGGLIVLDTQSAMTIGLKENDNNDAAKIMFACNALARSTRATVLFVHHNGWAEEGRARGASGLFAGLDTELQLVEAKRPMEVLVMSRKQRYAERLRPIPLALVAHDGALVVTGARGAGTADGFFGDDEAVRARALMAKLHEYRATGGEFKLTVRSITATLRTELNERGDRRLFERVAHLMKAEAGQPVNLAGDEDDET